jgi:hypothetical protein
MVTDHLKSVSDAIPGSDGLVSVSRWRWDLFFSGATAITALLGVAFYVYTTEISSVYWPLNVIPLWLAIRWGMRKDGIPAKRVSAVPGGLAMAIWAVVSLATASAYYMYRTLYLGESPYKPLESTDVAIWTSIGV